jgi:acyl-CoA synthetase (AMP-forming)/AMP-acid ligase II
MHAPGSTPPLGSRAAIQGEPLPVLSPRASSTLLLQVALRYLDSSGKETAALTYQVSLSGTIRVGVCQGPSPQELEGLTHNLAEKLLNHDEAKRAGAPPLAPGDRALLVFVPSIEFYVAFLACLRAGIVAVPVYPPNPQGASHHLRSFASIAKISGAKVAITHSSFSALKRKAEIAEAGAKALRALLGREAAASFWPDMPWWDVEIERTSREHRDPSRGVVCDGSRSLGDVAFLQFTSGSTSEPKGVVVSHRALSHNLRSIVTSLDADESTSVVSWLPQYHDMGLVGSHCGLVFCGGSGTYMSPVSFVQHPTLMIRAMATYHATHVQSPNFGYALAARKWREESARGRGHVALGEGALGSVRHLFNAAEPVTSAACDAFLAECGPAGLRGGAMSPGYGLAESTVYVTDAGRLRLRIDRLALERTGEIQVVAVRVGPLSITRGGGAEPAEEWRRTRDGEGCLSVCKTEAGWVYDAGLSASPEAVHSDPACARECPPWLVELCGLGAPPLVGHGMPVFPPIDLRFDLGAPAGGHDEGHCFDLGSSAERCASNEWRAWCVPGGSVAIVNGASAVGVLGLGPLLPEELSERIRRSDDGPTPLQAWPPTEGEVWLRGASQADGYWGKLDETTKAFSREIDNVAFEAPPTATAAAESEATAASMAGSGSKEAPSAVRLDEQGRPVPWHRTVAGSGPGLGWVSTGDQGFLWGGELFLTGRLKDMVIIGGRNHYPQDLEATAEALGASEASGVGILRPGCTAAFSVPAPMAAQAASAARRALKQSDPAEPWGGTEGEALVVVGEPRPDPASGKLPSKKALEKVARALAGTIAAAHGVTPSLVLLLRAHSARKTSSGKIARKWNAKAIAQLAAELGDARPTGDDQCPWTRESGAILAVYGPSGEELASALEPREELSAEELERRGAATGEELMELLRLELAVCGGVPDPKAIPVDTAVGSMGLSSLSVAQWVGVCRQDLGLAGFGEQAVWHPNCTLEWVAANADAFRRGEALVPPETDPEAVAAASGHPKTTTPVVIPGVVPPTWCQKNCPCCPCVQ